MELVAYAANGHSVAVDDSGNVYTTGSFSGTDDFDPGPGTFYLTAAGADTFIQKLDASGNFVWAKRMGTSTVGETSGNAIAVDAAGYVYTTGTFEHRVDFDPGAGTFYLTSKVNSDDIFIQKLDSSGNFLWAKSFGSASDEFCKSIAVDSAGSVYTTGYFQTTVDFDPGAGVFKLKARGYIDIFIQKLDTFGNFL